MPLIRQIVLVLAATAAAGCPNDSLAPETSPDSSTADTAGSLGVGTPCDVLAVNPGPTQAIFNNQALECPSRICLKPLDQTGEADTTAFCASECSTDSDCVGATRDPSDPNDKRCVTGYACGVAFVVGPLCCKKLCLCKDFLAGPLQTPMACDPSQNNGGTACAESP
ncbi:MAG TPA: hypothetical protein VJ801_00790 [Polyangia bacterium]|jgi:hypothetical protein|nr:hypothetical protein [Polyangia bacterium]